MGCLLTLKAQTFDLGGTRKIPGSPSGLITSPVGRSCPRVGPSVTDRYPVVIRYGFSEVLIEMASD